MAVYVSEGDIENSLKTLPQEGKRLLEPLKTFAKERGLPLNILEDVRIENAVEIHRHEADLWFCLEGEAEFISGGTAVEPFIPVKSDGSKNTLELKAKAITGGTTYVVRKGDWLFIPAGEPHLHKSSGVARLAIIKIPQAPVPLEAFEITDG